MDGGERQRSACESRLSSLSMRRRAQQQVRATVTRARVLPACKCVQFSSSVDQRLDPDRLSRHACSWCCCRGTSKTRGPPFCFVFSQATGWWILAQDEVCGKESEGDTDPSGLTCLSDLLRRQVTGEGSPDRRVQLQSLLCSRAPQVHRRLAAGDGRTNV